MAEAPTYRDAGARPPVTVQSPFCSAASLRLRVLGPILYSVVSGPGINRDGSAADATVRHAVFRSARHAGKAWPGWARLGRPCHLLPSFSPDALACCGGVGERPAALEQCALG